MKHTAYLAAACLCTCAAHATSPFISHVYEYRPAPGQFVNELPEYEEGDTYESILAKAAEQLVGDRMPGMVTLGAFGGYVVFGFDHPVANKPGEPDFKIYGNAIISDRDRLGGSSEPGIVMVSRDDNGNGLPDDTWYELAGSEHGGSGLFRGFEITYTAPDPARAPVPDPADKNVTDTAYIPWTSNDPGAHSGFVTRNAYHAQSYWPMWMEQTAEMRFSGTRLPANAEDVNGDGSYYVLRCYGWGYADNLPNTEDKGFDIGWAVDSEGRPVALSSIDFVKVYTAVCQTCGSLGESSTEISGAEDLHPAYVSGTESITAGSRLLITAQDASSLKVRTDRESLPYSIYASSGALVGRGVLTLGDNTIDTAPLPVGLYLLATEAGTLRFMKHGL